ncbi:ATP-dependent DNA helicase RecG [Raineyella antarctica]|uniref:ATP-dependent DNA helicase RecG n=1 Tax=Raineyella antarctica TaxID=1577474 RepID=A0A1G6HAR4_9ACTN|nr:ATP-dependent DNA helicase RecG [Raineyella antarctica]SDB91387.1 ATP-dependent DNA helicase RecG [Raineyella antarctica]
MAAGGWRSEAYAALDQRIGLVVGAQEKSFAAMGIRTVGDLMHHVPRRYVVGTELSDLSEVEVGTHVALLARVAEVRAHPGPPGRKGRGRLEVRLTDGRTKLPATFFGANHLLEWWQRSLQPGARGIFSAKVGEFRGEPQLSHPDYVIVDEQGFFVAGSDRNRSMASVFRGGPIGIYPASAKLPTWDIAEAAGLTLHALGDLPDPWPDWVREAGDVLPLVEALRAVHQPPDLGQVEAGLERLSFDEALEVQLTMAYRRADHGRLAAIPRDPATGGLLEAFDQRLPFELTEGQQQVGAEIAADLGKDLAMQRLLQGEVGSGKTVVALRAMLSVVDTGGQSALLAPTEVLAVQHFRSISTMLGDLAGGGMFGGTRVVLLTGSMTAAQKKKALLAIASGEAGIAIGTHALLSDAVQFADLGLVVVDEQHRFGVEQRNALNAKAALHPHVLVMTATPIPRSVALTIYGDLEVSTLREVPAGRSDVTTNVVDVQAHPRWVERAWERAREEVAQGRQVFVVCPRITPEGDAYDPENGWSLEEVVDRLAGTPLGGVRIAALHGQMATEDKDRVMSEFAAGAIDVLVATTVIEVGVDVPNASMMVVCDAGRFGISQLHQLRGRIGRGQFPGLCLLLAAAQEDTTMERTMERLHGLAATRDGFALADLDLAQRREGNVLGTNQAGSHTGMRLLNVTRDADLIGLARDVAERAVALDPDAQTPGFRDAIRRMELVSLDE